MSEIGNNNSPIALTQRNAERPTDSRPLARPVAENTDRFKPDVVVQAEQSGVAKQPEKEVDLSIRSLEDGDPLEKAAEALEKFIPDVNALPNTKLRINRNDETGRFVYQNIDNESGEVVRQFPPEDLLEFLAFYQELRGQIVDDEV